MISRKRLEELKQLASVKMSLEYSRMVSVHPAELKSLIEEIEEIRARKAEENYLSERQ